MSKDPKQFAEIFKCPDCGNDLIIDDQNFKCEKCGRIIPVIDDVSVFLSQKEIQDFFTDEYLDIYCSDIYRESVKELLKSENYIEGLKKMVEHVNSEGKMKEFIGWFDVTDDTLDPKLAESIKKSVDVMIRLSNIKDANLSLDWPTGNGFLMRSAVKEMKDNATIIAFDVNFVTLCRTRKYLEAKGLANRIIFINGDVRNMPFKNNVFDLVTAWGGTIEVPNADIACGESYRVLKPEGTFVTDGDVFKENSQSLKIAESLNLHHLATKERMLECFNNLGFKDIKTETIMEDIDRDTLPDEERCPLPAKGDWFSLVEIVGRK